MTQAELELNYAETVATPEQTKKAVSPWLGIGVVAIAGIGYGIQGILGKYAYAGNANVETLLTIRFIVAFIAVWGLILVMVKSGRQISLKQSLAKTLGFGFLGLLWISNSLFYFKGLELLPASTAALLVYVYPAFVVTWSVLFFNEKMSWLKGGALILALFGCFLTVDPVVAFAAGATFSFIGAFWVLGSALSNSWYAVLAGVIGKGTSGLIVAAYGLPVTAVAFILYTALTGSFNFNMTPAAWIACLSIGALTAISMILYLAGISIIGASKASIIATSEPAGSVLFGALLLSEPMTAAKLSGGLCIIFAILLLSRKKKELRTED